MEFDFQGIVAEPLVNDTIFCSDPPFLVPFYGSGSDIPMHYWDFGDGTVGEGQQVVHVYQDAVTYTVSLKIKDVLY